MADESKPEPVDPDAASAVGAPIAKDAIDPDLIKLRRPRPEVGIITAIAIVALCAFFWFRLGPDRQFGNSATSPRAAAVSDILAGEIATDQLIAITAEPWMAHAVRASTTKGTAGLRVVPARGTGDRLWLVIPGDGLSAVSEQPNYVGRLRRLRDLPLADDIEAYLHHRPRPVFAPPAAVRAAIAGAPLRTVNGDQVTVRDSDSVSVDVIDLESCILVVTFNERLPDAKAWTDALLSAGLLSSAVVPQQSSPVTARYTLPLSTAVALERVQKAGLWAARIEPILRSHLGTWGQLRTSPDAQFAIGNVAIPDAQIDLIGVFVARGLPSDAYALIASESPSDYWYVRPISIALLVLGALFSWILARAVRRDLAIPRPLQDQAPTG
jgi:hypothetical protein